MARALESALDIEPEDGADDEAPAPPKREASRQGNGGNGGKARGWSEDQPAVAPRARAVPKGRESPAGAHQQASHGRNPTPSAGQLSTARETPRRSRPVVVAPRARLHVEDKPTGEAQDTWGLAKLSEKVTAASSRDDLAREVVEYVAQHFKRAAVFAVRHQRAAGWIGKGPGFFPERVEQTSIPLDEPSLFRGVHAPYIGPVPDTEENWELFAFLGGTVPPAVVIVPVMVRDRLVSVLYADNDSDPLVWVDLAIWKRVAEMMAIALEILILRNKARSV